MRNKLTESLNEAIKSILPISILIIIVSLMIEMPLKTIIAFIISAFLLIIGMSLFTVGIDISMITIGNSIGNYIVKRKNKILILLVSLVLGIVITFSEPDLNVFAKEITAIPSKLIVGLVSLGIGIFLMIGVLRILNRSSYKKVISISLICIFILLFFTKKEFISIAFDGGSVTTGPIGVPLILAYGYGIAKIRSDKDVKSDSFGLCGLASLGPVIVILILGLFFRPDNYFDTTVFVKQLSLINRFIYSFFECFKDVIFSLLPILVVFLLFQLFGKRLSKTQNRKIFFGLIFTILGLTIFLTGVSVGFIEIGYRIGSIFAENTYKYLLIPLGMLMGYIIINVEPAVKILNKQVSDLTEGSISEKLINLCLSIGVCISIGLALFRVFFEIPMIYIIVPGYFIAAVLMYFTPKVFMTVAFDSGGAASGAMTTSFLLPLCIGACEVLGHNILVYAFGVGALVGLSPIITIQALGIIYARKVHEARKIVHEEIIEYNWGA